MKERMNPFDKHWWKSALPLLLSFFSTIALLRSAGMWPTKGVAQFAVYLFCYLGFWRCFSGLVWLGCMMVAPRRSSN
jgi:hypothetical protein